MSERVHRLNLRAHLHVYRLELRQGVRVAVAGVVAFFVVGSSSLPHGYWAVLTAILVVQSSVGGSLGAALDRLIGTVSGAAIGGIVAVLHPGTFLTQGASLALAVTPLAVVAALRPTFRIAPITAAIVLLTDPGHGSPVLAAWHRVLEIGLGTLIGVLTSLVVLPSRAHEQMRDHSARILGYLGDLLRLHLDSLCGQRDETEIDAGNDRVRAAIGGLESIAVEAARERASWLSDEPDPRALLRTLRRLRHDLILIGRVTIEPLPAPIDGRLQHPVAALSAATQNFLVLLAAGLPHQQLPPPYEPVVQALHGYTAAVQALRQDRLLRQLPIEDAEQIFALSFAFGQLVGDLRDGADRARELAAGATKTQGARR